ncbi:MAG: SufE family protein [Alphaproteobacteria bacterium]|nr:SufE family protein [Alphaproteobacteria bacterium]MBN2675554.1 SufE family protein [Alphaproteobacteria bacterium]
MNYSEIKNILISISDPVEKLEMVMDFGKRLSDVPQGSECTEISGCMSFVKICRIGNKFYGIADSLMVRGIVFIIISMVDGKSPEEIKKINTSKEFMELNINLGAGRMNGINSILGFLDNL